MTIHDKEIEPDEEIEYEYHISSLPDAAQRHLMALEPDGIPLSRLKEYLSDWAEWRVVIPQDAIKTIMVSIKQRVASGTPLKVAKASVMALVDEIWGNAKP